ncbi:MAG: dCTP deaminase [Candidatus Thermoplasmatota archaeon]
MAALSDAGIKRLLATGALNIDPFMEEHLTPNGYDVSVAEVYIPRYEEKICDGTVIIPPMSRFVVSTVERIELKGPYSAQIWIRTTWARRGVLASFGRIDSGFRGTLTLAAFNASHEVLSIPIGERFAQVVIELLDSAPEKGYGERSGHYQDQDGVTLAQARKRINP